jgi:hypothetical protein
MVIDATVDVVVLVLVNVVMVLVNEVVVVDPTLRSMDDVVVVIMVVEGTDDVTVDETVDPMGFTIVDCIFCSH